MVSVVFGVFVYLAGVGWFVLESNKTNMAFDIYTCALSDLSTSYIATIMYFPWT